MELLTDVLVLLGIVGAFALGVLYLYAAERMVSGR